MRSLVTAWPIALVLFGAARAEDVRVEDPSQWTRLEAGRIVVITNAGERRAAAVAREIEAFSAVLERTTRNLDVRPKRETAVYLFRDSKSMAPFLGSASSEHFRGLFFRTGERNLVLVNATPPRNVEDTRASRGFVYPNRELFHEWTHAVLKESFPNLPLWLHEGIAEYFSTMYIDGKYAEVGRAPDGRAGYVLAGEPMPMTLLFQVRNAGRDLRDDRALQHFYAQSWAIVHYCLRGSESRKKEFGFFLGALRERVPQEQAWKNSFTASPMDVATEAFAHVKEGHFKYVRHPLSEIAPSKPSAARPIAPADLLAELGALALVMRPEQPRQAGARFEAALAIDPQHARALGGLAAARALQEKLDDVGLAPFQSAPTP